MAKETASSETSFGESTAVECPGQGQAAGPRACEGQRGQTLPREGKKGEVGLKEKSMSPLAHVESVVLE